MLGYVLKLGKQFEIIRVVIAFIFVSMMDMMPIRNGLCVTLFPNKAMEPDAVSLEILATEVVPNAVEFLNCF
jgi:hypothetical protein